jgi:hypothetical protein
MADQEQREQLPPSGRPSGPIRRPPAPSPAAFAGHGLQLAISIVALMYLGKWLDGKLGTSPLLMIVGVFAGAAVGIYNMYHALTAALRDQERERGKQKK